MKYHIAAVSRMTNLSVDVIRSWERRYGLVAPERDEAGLRLYSDDDVARLSLARAATQMGHPIRRVATMSNGELESLADEREPAGERYGDVAERVIAALENHEAQVAEQVLASAALLVPARSLVLDILAPVLRAVGERWESGRIAVWQEHLLSTIVRNTAGAVSRSAQTGDPILFATPPFELHEFGIALAAMLAASHGRRAINLGTAVPAGELVQAAKRLSARAIVIGMTKKTISAASAIEYVEAIDRGVPAETTILLGGTLGSQVAEHLRSGRVRATPTLEAFDAAVKNA
ncbi:MAG TPA: MerR family transcriptional regulator [Candidatus Baltobacteraceae bacterium]|nr:MerR family transcriptional regulator [Candidatus Baltobacteraceae bacterium]